MYKISTVYKQKHSKTVLNQYVRGKEEMDYFTGGSIVTDYGLVFWPEATV